MLFRLTLPICSASGLKTAHFPNLVYSTVQFPMQPILFKISSKSYKNEIRSKCPILIYRQPRIMKSFEVSFMNWSYRTSFSILFTVELCAIFLKKKFDLYIKCSIWFVSYIKMRTVHWRNQYKARVLSVNIQGTVLWFSVYYAFHSYKLSLKR